MSRSLHASHERQVAVQIGTAHAQQSLTAIPVPGTPRLPPHPPQPSHVQMPRRSSMAFSALWTHTSLYLRG